MKIIVCIKQVPDTTDIKWTENNTIQREGVESVINPFDVYAIEKALQVKKELENVKKQFDVYKAKMESLLISQLELIKEINKEDE